MNRNDFYSYSLPSWIFGATLIIDNAMNGYKFNFERNGLRFYWSFSSIEQLRFNISSCVGHYVAMVKFRDVIPVDMKYFAVYGFLIAIPIYYYLESGRLRAIEKA